MSKIIVHESTDLTNTSTDDELERLNNKDLGIFVKQMANSMDNVDQRFLNLYRVRNATHQRMKVSQLELDELKQPEPDHIKEDFLKTPPIKDFGGPIVQNNNNNDQVIWPSHSFIDTPISNIGAQMKEKRL